MHLNKRYFLWYVLVVGAIFSACTAGGDNQGLEFAPNMYHSVPYEPLTQITDEGAGSWVSSLDNGVGEYYNSNPHNPNRMTMREPVPHTVRRGQFLPYRIPKDSLILAARVMINPLDSSEAVLKDGKVLYDRFCEHCHGAKGEGDGLVAEKYPGVANLKGVAYQSITEGHIFHVITMGKGLMGAHGSQISEEDRWKISRYVKALQSQ